jgi:uncharacterized protein YecT (DUF1311 family)
MVRLIIRNTIFLLSFLAAVNASEAQTPSNTSIKPSFDCVKVSSPLPLTLCNNENAANADWELSSAFWALHFSLEGPARVLLWRAQDDWFKSLVQSCSLGDLSTLSPVPTNIQATCVINAYRSRATSYRARLSGDALAEANFSEQRHKQIQEALISVGVLKGEPEGIFGPQTRNAIKAFQSNNKLAATGYLTAPQHVALFSQREKMRADKNREPGQVMVIENGPSKSSQITAAPAAAEQATPSIQKSESDPAKCSEASSAESALACTRLIGNRGTKDRDLINVVLNRARSYEHLGDADAALSDYKSILSLDPRAQTATDGINRIIERRAENQSPVPRSSADQLMPVDGTDSEPLDQLLLLGSRHPLLLGLLAAILLTQTGVVVVIAFRRLRGQKHTSRTLAAPSYYSVRTAGVLGGFALLALSGDYLWLGGAQTLLLISPAAHHIPLSAQAYLLIPNFNNFLGSAQTYLESNADSLDVARVSKAIGAPYADVQTILSRFQSVLHVSVRGEDQLIANGCINFSREDDRRTIGLLSTTSAAAYIARQTDASPIVVLSPVNKSRFAAFLANSSSRYLIVLSLTQQLQNDDTTRLTIDNWFGPDFRLCRKEGAIRDISAGSTFQIDKKHTKITATLDPVALLTDASSFELGCSYDLSGIKHPCQCEVFERRANESEIASLGDCGTVGKTIGKAASSKRSLAAAIERGGLLDKNERFNIPLLGPISAQDGTLIRWHGKSFVIGLASLLEGSVAGTNEAPRTSILRDDSMVKLFKRVSIKPSAFLGAIRPDLYSGQSFFNRLVSLPIVFAGAISAETLTVQASVNFEPLDAKILQDISRDHSDTDGEMPIGTSFGSANVRIGDDKISQYVSFADQYVLGRILEGLSTLDTQDPEQNLRTNFIRYILRKIGVRDETSFGGDRLFANQPIQIIVLDDQQQAWEPSLAVAVKFQSYGDAHAFLCGERSAMRRNLDYRIILGAARAAKSKTAISDDENEYKKELENSMQELLGVEDWKRLKSRYDIDPFLMRVSNRSPSSSALDQGSCKPDIPNMVIDGKAREMHYLSPPATNNSKLFYYRIPEILTAAKQRSTEYDKEIKEALDQLVTSPEELALLKKAKDQLALVLKHIEGQPASMQLVGALKDEATLLRSMLDDAEIDIPSSEWATISDIQTDVDDGALLTVIDKRAGGNDGFFLERAASLRIQREQALLRAQRIAEEVPKDSQRVVAFIDESRRLLFIASNLDVLTRSAAQASAAERQIIGERGHAAERIRFFASGDNAVQSILDVLPDKKQAEWSDRWRSAKLGGPILPFKKTTLGISGQTTGVVFSLDLPGR